MRFILWNLFVILAHLSVVMSASHICVIPYIDRAFCDEEVVENTVKLQMFGQYVPNEEVLYHVVKFLEIDMENVVAFYRMDKPREWFIEFTTSEPCVELKNAGHIAVNQQSSFVACHISTNVELIRVHWMPTYMKAEFLYNFFKRFGEVVDVCNVVNPNTKIDCGTREVYLITRELKNIPYKIAFKSCVSTILITVKGRQPWCLKCDQIGHRRNSCGKLEREIPMDRPANSPQTMATQEVTQTAEDLTQKSKTNTVSEHGNDTMDTVSSTSTPDTKKRKTKKETETDKQEPYG